MSPTLRRWLIPLAVAFAIAVPALQAGLDLGLSAKEFAGDGDATLRAAPYAFSIWSVIYAGLIAYAVWQALPRNAGDERLARIAGPSIVAILGCGLWIIASSANWKWASIGIIVTSAAALITGLVQAASRGLDADLRERVLVWWPLGLLAGWLTVAAALNILTVLTAEGLLSGLSRAAAFAGIVVVLVVALSVLRATRIAAYGVPVAWGLTAVWAAERAEKPDVAALALGAAVLTAAFAAWIAWKGRGNAHTA